MASTDEMFAPLFKPTSTSEQIKAYASIAAVYDDHYGCAVTYGKCLDMLEPYLPDGPVRLLDAGCGTGLLGPLVAQSARARDINLIGLDYSPEMLLEAEKKGVYNELFVADFSAPFQIKTGPVDSFVISAVFLDNHAHMSCLVNIAAHLRQGATAIFSVRGDAYDRDPEEPARYIQEAGCTLVKMTKDIYGKKGSFTGYYFIIQKN